MSRKCSINLTKSIDMTAAVVYYDDVKSIKQTGGDGMGFKIKERREELGMTQEELAKESRVSRGTIVALESGRDRATTTKTLYRIAAALNTTVDRIFFTDNV